MERSGHSVGVHNEHMIIFGGIFEVTKELNDVHIFNMKTSKWVCLQEETNSPIRPGKQSPQNQSPLLRMGNNPLIN